MSDEAPKPRKQKNFAQINGACKMARLSDGLSPKACPVCGNRQQAQGVPVLPPSAREEIEPLSGGAAGQQRAGKT